MDKPEKPQEKESPRPSQETKGSDQELARQEKVKKLIEAGIDLYPHRAEKTHSVHEAVAEFVSLTKEELEQKKIRVVVPGRIMSIRRMGRAVFFHISDSRSKLQVYLREDVIGAEKFEIFDLFDIGDFVSVAGEFFKTKTGELTILAKSYTLLAKAFHPLPEKWHGLQDIELRYRKRYLDLIMNPEVGEVFRLRSSLISLMRKFFDARGFIEVETPMMHPVPGGALAKPFKTFHNALGIDLYLRIAPELYLKRLSVGGFEKVYEINRNFRNEGISSEHNPEFTMLEFYQAYIDYHDLMEMTEELLSSLAMDIHGREELPYGEKTISLKRPWKRIKYRDAVFAHSGLSPELLNDSQGLIKFARDLAGEKESLTPVKALDVVFDKLVKPQFFQPTFVTNTPREISPFAKSTRENPEETARFELMVAGMEIANAFSELTDAAEQKRRFELQAEERKKGVEEAHWIDTDYVEALEYGLPPTGGEGIGIDRLTMLFANRKSIREVILFPLLRPKQ
jgi:lysyl-tRNA synthetase class 2